MFSTLSVFGAWAQNDAEFIVRSEAIYSLIASPALIVSIVPVYIDAFLGTLGDGKLRSHFVPFEYFLHSNWEMCMKFS